MRNKNRILLPEFGILNAVDEEIRTRMVRGLPYRLTEGRIVLLLKGEGIMHVRLQTFHVKAPAVVILSPGVIAQIEDISKAEQVRFLVFQNDFICEPKPSDLLQKYLNGMLNVFLPLKEEEALCVEQYYQTIWQTLQTKGWQREVIRHLVFGGIWFVSLFVLPVARTDAVRRETSVAAGASIQSVYPVGQSICQSGTECVFLCRQAMSYSSVSEQSDSASQQPDGDGLD